MENGNQNQNGEWKSKQKMRMKRKRELPSQKSILKWKNMRNFGYICKGLRILFNIKFDRERKWIQIKKYSLSDKETASKSFLIAVEHMFWIVHKIKLTKSKVWN